jgi:plastocyanin
VDPEQIYQEVLQEEQQRGSTPAVAEGRAKAARVRAEHGSPHPKEPKWWPGAQPHLEGGGEPEAPGQEVAAPAPEEHAEQPAAAAAPSAPAATEERQAPVVEADAPLAPVEPPPPAPVPQPAQDVPAAAAPAAVAVAPPAATTGVSHGVSTGTRLRPEDEVSTEAQFDGQRAMYERRRLIDEVIKTGVPATAATESSRSSSALLAVLYLLIPLAVIFFLASTKPETAAAPPGGAEAPGGDAGTTIVAQNTAFQTDTIEASAGKDVSYTLDNQDQATHNFALFASEAATESPDDALYTSPDAAPGSSVDLNFTAPDKPGDYPFICEYHPTTMKGTVTVTK